MTNGQNNNNQDDMYVNPGDISYLIVQVLPTNQYFLDPTAHLDTELEDLKYDVCDLDTS